MFLPMALLLVLADAKEREKFFLSGQWLLPLRFSLYVGVWLLGFAALALCEVYLYAHLSHSDLLPEEAGEEGSLPPAQWVFWGYKATGYLVLAAGWQFWVSHHFRAAALLHILASVLGGALSVLHQALGQGMPPLLTAASLLWAVVLSLAALAHYNFAAQHLHHKLGARDLGRLATPVGRLSANPFVLPQTPDLFVTESIESQREKYRTLLAHSS